MSKKQKKETQTDDMNEKEKVESPSESTENVVETEDSAPEETTTEDQLVEAQGEISNLKDQMLRLAADFENYKKRSERERAQTMKYVGEHIFREFLPAVDNLERAIDQGAVEGTDTEKNLAGLLEGVELTLKSMQASLQKFEVTPIESVGEPFDPNKQEAMTMEASDNIPANHIISEFEKGYYYKDRLLRAAKVIVSSGKAEG